MQHFFFRADFRGPERFRSPLEFCPRFNCPSDDCARKVIRVANERARKKARIAPGHGGIEFFFFVLRQGLRIYARIHHFLIAVPAPEHVGHIPLVFDGIVLMNRKVCFALATRQASGSRWTTRRGFGDYHACSRENP